jgi:hypothetical protein
MSLTSFRQEAPNGIYVYRQTQLILGGMCYYAKAQLHVSAIKVGHLQVVHENLSIGYTNYIVYEPSQDTRIVEY